MFYNVKANPYLTVLACLLLQERLSEKDYSTNHQKTCCKRTRADEIG